MKRSKQFYQNFRVNGYNWAFWDEDLDAHCFTRKNKDGTFSTCYLCESDFDDIEQKLKGWGILDGSESEKVLDKELDQYWDRLASGVIYMIDRGHK